MPVKLEEKVSTLEIVLEQFILQTNSMMESLHREMTEFKEEMRANRIADREENRREHRRMNRQWGELAQKMGTMVEDLVYPSFERILKETFDVEVTYMFRNGLRRLPGGHEREFDIVALTSDGRVFLNSTKSSLDSRDIKNFIEKEIPAFRKYYPEYADKEIGGVMASLYIHEPQIKYANRKGVLVLGVGDELMEVKNGPKFKAKFW